MPAGRPSKKQSIELVMVERLASKGLTDSEIAEVIGVDSLTLNRWKADERILNALKKGKEVSDNLVVKALYKRAIGFEYDEVTYERSNITQPHSRRSKDEKEAEIKELKVDPQYKTKVVTKYVPPSESACIFWLKNRQKDDWRDQHDHVVSGDVFVRYGYRDNEGKPAAAIDVTPEPAKVTIA